MLTVCIPVYNQNVERLVKELSAQVKLLHGKVSILLIDDASSEEFQAQYNNIRVFAKVVQLDVNIGRSKIRNAFLEYTSADYLLFLDCDAQIVRSDFLSMYLEFIKVNRPKVLFGASIYQKESPPMNYRLRWKYGSMIESKSFQFRISAPQLGFKTNNFLVDRNILKSYPFNELITGYGHEDTLFGFELEQNGISICHIDNPVLNAHLDSNSQFLNKTDEALNNLFHIWELSEKNESLLERLNILKVYFKHERNLILSITLRCLIRPLRFLLERGVSSLTLFNLYKLAYLFAFNPAQRRQ